MEMKKFPDKDAFSPCEGIETTSYFLLSHIISMMYLARVRVLKRLFALDWVMCRK